MTEPDPVSGEMDSLAGFVEVAVPLPLPGALTYALPPRWRGRCPAGTRVRVPVGKRRLVGLVLAELRQPPPGLEIREVIEALDPEPLLSPDLLELARFAADYYLAPIGEVVRSLLPSSLGASGQRRLRITDRGALALPRDEAERHILGVLLERGTVALSELAIGLAGPLLGPVERLAQEGKVRIEDSSASRRRLESAFELLPLDTAMLLERCGRSPKARAVVELLRELGRPATSRELSEAAGCGTAVLRRLVEVGVLRRFQQYKPAGVERHLLGGGSASAPLVLREDQARAADRLTAALAAGAFRGFLLSGVTGSGKTEVYLRLLAAALELGRGAIVLVPEIALVPSLARSLRERFGARVALLHSALGSAEREEEWQRVRTGEAPLVVGPRSAVFAPVARLGVVVVDEEHDAAYKQDRAPRYSGRDLALVRAQRAAGVAVLTSATPSLESRHGCEIGRLIELRLERRVGSATLPEGRVIDLRSERYSKRPGEVHFSQALIDEITASLAGDGQVILLRNRRGYAPLLLCRACGEDMRCEECGLPRTLHRRDARLQCHYCGSRRPVPASCPRCGEAALEAIGAGTERVEDRFRELFPDVPVDVLDRDSSQRAGGAAAVLERFRLGRSRVLVGTQMVSKGHHFPRVSLAAVLNADTYLGFPDFRAVERTYSMLTQLAGRAGRGDAPGRFVIQTHYPEHYAVRAALEHDDARFAAEELRFRRTFHYPPFTRVVLLLVEDRRRERALEHVERLASAVARHPGHRALRVSGPAPAPFERLRGKWRFQLLLRSDRGALLRRIARELQTIETASEVTVDVDPQDLL